MSDKTNQIIAVEAKEWFDKVNGNSYFSARCFINNKCVLALPMQYGYGSHYEYEALKAMNDAGLISGYESGQSPWIWADSKGIEKPRFTKQENCLKRDVKAWGELEI